MRLSKQQTTLSVLAAVFIVIGAGYWSWSYTLRTPEKVTAVENLPTDLPIPDARSKQEAVENAVRAMKARIQLPMVLNEYSTITDITAEPGALRMHYRLVETDPEGLTDAYVRKTFAPTICASKNRVLLKLGISFEYAMTYDSALPPKIVAITEDDCLVQA